MSRRTGPTISKLYGSRYPRDDYDWRAYYFLDQIQGYLLKGLDDTCCRPAADGRICRQMESRHSHDGFCPQPTTGTMRLGVV